MALSLVAYGVSVPATARQQMPRPGQAIQEEWRPRVEVANLGGVAELRVNGVVILRVRDSRGGLSPTARAEAMAARLKQSIDSGLTPDGVSVTVENIDGPALMLGDVSLITVPMPAPPTKAETAEQLLARTKRDTAVRNASVLELQKWAAALKKALIVPGLTVRETGIVLPPGGKQKLTLSGPARGPISILAEMVAAGGEKTVSVSTDPTTGAITLTGLRVGRDKLTLMREGAVATVYVSVRPYAAQIDTPAPVTVTGAPAPAALIARQVVNAVQSAIQTTPGATVKIADNLETVPLEPGRGATLTIPVRATGSDMFPVERNVIVSVVNRPLPPVRTAALFFSNDPELVRQPGVLFVGRLSDEQAANRLLYHHQSAAPKPLRFSAEVVNDSNEAIAVQVVGGDAGPVRDTVWVGYRAASEFVRAHDADSGVVVGIPPRCRLPLSSLRLNPGLTISGLLQVRVLSGPAPLVRVATADADSNPLEPILVATPIGDEIGFAGANSLSDHVYRDPTKNLEETYTVGQPWTFIRFGRNPLQSATNPETVLFGNYGVFYDITLHLNNPTDQPAPARLIFDPSAGLASGLFVVDGQKIEIPQINIPRDYTLASYMLQPGEAKTVRIRTMPISGSNYPATIVVKP